MWVAEEADEEQQHEEEEVDVIAEFEPTRQNVTEDLQREGEGMPQILKHSDSF